MQIPLVDSFMPSVLGYHPFPGVYMPIPNQPTTAQMPSNFTFSALQPWTSSNLFIPLYTNNDHHHKQAHHLSRDQSSYGPQEA